MKSFLLSLFAVLMLAMPVFAQHNWNPYLPPQAQPSYWRFSPNYVPQYFPNYNPYYYYRNYYPYYNYNYYYYYNPYYGYYYFYR